MLTIYSLMSEIGDLEHHHADLGTVRMHYVARGDGPLVVLLHGFPEMWWSWRYQIGALADAGFRAVAPDLRGYNETAPKRPYDIDTLCRDVVELLDHLGAEATRLVGHDWGAALAWHLASGKASMRSRCLRLVAVNGPHPAVFARALLRHPRQLARSWYVLFFQLPWIPEWALTAEDGRGVIRIIRRSAVDKTRFGADELEPFAAAVRKPGRATAMIDWYRALPRGLLSLASREADYPPVGCPALIVWGLEDQALGYEDVVPGTESFATPLEVQTIAGAGHFVHEERPDEVNSRILEFLSRA